MAEYTSEAYVPDRLVAKPDLLVGQKITLASGQNLKRGSLLGKVTATGKYVLSLSGAADGSEVPDLVLAEDTDASAGDVVTVAYSRGDFDQRAITFGTGHTADSVRETLRGKGIVLVPSCTA